MENLRIVPRSVMFTVTAPGADVFPFDARFCVHSPSQKCSGRIGCRVDPDAAEAFNKIAGKWWSQLHRAAKVRADRATGHKGKILARVWEKQKRVSRTSTVFFRSGLRWNVRGARRMSRH